MNKLKDYINKNRYFFNDEEPSLEIKNLVLNSIGNSKKNKNIRIKKWFFAAAVLIIVVAISAFFSIDYIQLKMGEQAIAKAVPEYKEAEKYYTDQVNSIKKNLYVNDNSKLIEKDFETIDSMLVELKNELDLAPFERKKVIVKKIISGYKKEIKLLKRITEKKQIIITTKIES